MSANDEGWAGGGRVDEPSDRFRDWDAAYVLGSLTPAERHEYEQHLAGCAGCRAALADLAGMPGLLATVSPAEALGLLDEPVRATPSPTLLPALIARAGRARRRRRLFQAVGALAVAAAVAVALVVSFQTQSPSSVQSLPGSTAPSGQSADDRLTFTAEVQSPLSAVAVLGEEPWGTRIDWTCTYEGQAGDGVERNYAMLVTDRTGQATQVASWMSGPGTTATPTATTSIRRSDIAAVSIVSGETGTVLLRSVLKNAG
ncbi:hypothetical protein B7R54_15955 [Subtercola boreus]|uniref:Putative zinc-finger domain-containing protein n=1 Tax=Subtercola boreus TaxID=120213 RepID=A0A3E0VKN5_9MICO|nr:zf-HC2 domain-containing protein [Subtercola boreus]RFA10532.1 hypothetical protein B7R54_15955 [Subtercola boreus]TQL55929.1 putative zinc finger protein [Subtercola boreus]